MLLFGLWTALSRGIKCSWRSIVVPVVTVGGNFPLQQPGGFAGARRSEHAKAIDVRRPAGICHLPRPARELHIVMEIQEGGIGWIRRACAFDLGVQSGGAIRRGDPAGPDESEGICCGLGRSNDYVKMDSAITE